MSSPAAGGPTVRRRWLFVSLASYDRAGLPGDLAAALTLVVIAVPEQLATSRLAGMPPISAFYAFIAGSLFIAVLGSNPQMSVGADSTIAPLFAVGIAHLAPLDSARYVDLVGILAVMVGLIVAIVGLLGLGWIAEFLSTPIITGFMAGVAVIIVVHQLPELLGLSSVSGSTLHRLVTTLGHLGTTNGWSLGIGAGTIGIVLAAELVDKRLPGALVALIGSTSVVAAFGLHNRGVAVLGSFAHGAPRFGLEGMSWSALGSVAPVAGVVALVVLTQTAATSRAFGERGGFEPDIGRDLLGVGAGSVLAGLSGSFPVDASPPRTAAVASAGGRTQLVSIIAALVFLPLIPLAGLLRDVPAATLAGILLVVALRILRVHDIGAIARFDKFEFALTIVTLLSVALIGVEQGIAIAVALAVVDRARLAARPKLHVLGRIDGTTSWVPVEGRTDAHEMPGVLVVLFATPLWYANASHFRDQVEAELAKNKRSLIVFDVLGMSDIDFTGSKVLAGLIDQLDRQHIAVGMGRAGSHLRDGLARAGLLSRIGADHLYPSVDEAVRALAPSAKH